MAGFISFIKTKTFWKHLALASLSAFVLLFLLLKYLDIYTHHGEAIAVPDFTNQEIANLDKFVENKNVSYQIIDSIYDPKQKPGIVIRQDPEIDEKVKEGRIIYLYVTSKLPPTIAMPKLRDRSERQAVAMIESYGLKVKVSYKSGVCNGCVIEQYYQGKEIKPGDPIKKGSIIEILVGKNEGSAISDPNDSLNAAPTDPADDNETTP